MGKSWRWLRVRILGLLSVPPVIIPGRNKSVLVQQTRLALALNPPEV